MKTIITVFAAFVALSACADEVATSGRWSFRAGYAWRANAKTDFSGTGATAPAGGAYENGSLDGFGGWTGGDAAKLPSVDGGVGSAVDGNDWALRLTRGESVASGSDEDGMHGMNINAGYDFYAGRIFSVGVLTHFAGYWGLENSTSGGYSRYNDYARFPLVTGPGTTIDPTDNVDAPRLADRQYLTGGPGGRVNLRSDLYQVGLGPQVTWHAFEGWCDCLRWLDVYANVQALCNIIHSELNIGTASESATHCKIGFGGNVGLVGNITDWCGIYGQVGYEWVDKDEVSMRGISAETDYSSLVLSAGVQFRF